MKQFFFFLFFFIGTIKPVLGQETFSQPEEILQKLTTYSQLKPTEKAYLHLDKNVYSPGETIWFKAYITNARTHVPGTQSTVLYVELWDSCQNRLAKRNILVAEGFGAGDINLPDSLAPGKYFLKAYTRYMLNFDNAFFLSSVINIIGSKPTLSSNVQPECSNNKLHSTTEPTPLLKLTFYPEGGDLVNGLESRIAVKAVDAHGKGIAVSGKLINSSGDTISWFKTQRFGLGDIILKPTSADAYYAAVVNFQGMDFTFILPERKNSGFGMNIRNYNNKISIKATHSNPDELAGSFILGHLRGRAFSVIEERKGADYLYATLSTENIPTGIVHFTLFNKYGVPQSERLVFIDNPQDKVSLAIAPDKPTYGLREQATMSLSLTDTAGHAVEGKVSATVIDSALLQSLKDTDNINSYFLLSADLKGKIEQPTYYFDSTHQDRHYLLDLLMLTHGWRRFSWKQVLEEPTNPPSIAPEQGFTIQGQLYNYYRRDKEVKGTVKLMMLENPLFSGTDITSERGIFRFNNLHFNDTATFILQASKLRKKDKEGNDNIFISVDPDNIFLPASWPTTISSTRKPPIPDSLQKKLRQETLKIKQIDSAYNFQNRSIMLEEVAVAAKRNKNNDPFDRPGQIYGEPSSRLVLDSLPSTLGSLSAFDVLQGRAAGLSVVGTGFDKKVRIRGAEASYLLDGMPVDAELINTLPLESIAFIDIIKGAKASVFGSAGGSGVVAFYTKRGIGQKEATLEVPGIIHYKHPGYYLAREFYTPDYAEEDPQHAKPDFRSTLYWKPDITIGENGKAEFQFYTSDEKEEYVLLIEGITPDGRLITGKQTFSVK